MILVLQQVKLKEQIYLLALEVETPKYELGAVESPLDHVKCPALWWMNTPPTLGEWLYR